MICDVKITMIMHDWRARSHGILGTVTVSVYGNGCWGYSFSILT